MIAYKVDKRHWWKNPIEQIEINRVAGKVYYDCRGLWALETDARKVFTDPQEAAEYAMELQQQRIKSLDKEKQSALDRMKQILEFSDGVAQERADKAGA